MFFTGGKNNYNKLRGHYCTQTCQTRLSCPRGMHYNKNSATGCSPNSPYSSRSRSPFGSLFPPTRPTSSTPYTPPFQVAASTPSAPAPLSAADQALYDSMRFSSGGARRRHYKVSRSHKRSSRRYRKRSSRKHRKRSSRKHRKSSKRHYRRRRSGSHKRRRSRH